MARYIDADLIKYKRHHKIGLGIDYTVNEPSYCDIAYKTQIDAIPTADMQEVRHGYWMLHIEGFPEYDDPCNEYECSNCGYYDLFAPDKKVPYCWHCGAKMDGEE